VRNLKLKLVFIVSLVTGFFGVAANADNNRVQEFSHHYELTRQALESLLGHKISRPNKDLAVVLQLLKGCQVSELGEGELHLISGEGCGLNFQRRASAYDHGVNENGDPIIEIEVEENLIVESEDLVGVLGFSSWKFTEITRSETLVSTPVLENVSRTSGQFLTDAKQEVILSANTRHYINLETDEQPYFRDLTLKFEDFSTNFEIKATVQDGVATKVTARRDNARTSYEQLVELFTHSLIGF